MTRPAATPRWLGLLRVAVTVILVALFGAGTASTAAGPAPETRLGAHAVDTQGVVGPHRDVCADRWLGGDAVSAVPRLALEYVYDGGAASYEASARLVDVRTVVHVDGAGRSTNAMSLRRQSGAVLHGSVSVSGFVVAAKTGGGAGEHIVLGLRAHGLEQSAAKVGGRTLLSDTGWKTTLQKAIANPEARFSVSLEGMSGGSTYSQVMGAAQRGATSGASPTNWEMAQLYQAGRLPDTTFLRGGSAVSNPFGAP